MLIDSSLSNYDFKIKGQNKLKLLFANTKSDLKATVSPPPPITIIFMYCHYFA